MSLSPRTRFALALFGLWLFSTALLADNKAAPAKKELTEEQRQKNLESFEHVWKTVRDRHWDPRLGGIDWQAAHDETRPQVEKAQSTNEARAAMRKMLGRLGQSHFNILPAEVYDEIKKGSGEEKTGKQAGPGFDVRVVGDEVLVVQVDDGPAAKLSVRPGWLVVKIEGDELAPALTKIRKAYKDSTKLQAEQLTAVKGRLYGAPGKETSVTFRDGADKEVSLKVPLVKLKGKQVRLGHLPPIFVHFETRKLDGNIGYFALSTFLDAPQMMRELEEAVKAHRKGAGFILDLRGNPGGLGIMASGFAGWFVREPDKKLGTMSNRDGQLHFVLNPRAEAFDGPLAVLVDGMSGSTSEILAGGLQDLKRARIFGTRTMGAALPSIFERLANGDGFQYAFANYVSAGGQPLEGRGVIPDEIVTPDRPALLAGRDPILEAAVRWIRSKK